MNKKGLEGWVPPPLLTAQNVCSHLLIRIIRRTLSGFCGRMPVLPNIQNQFRVDYFE